MADIYSALMGQAPTTDEQRQTLISALRNQKLLGQLGTLSGDQVLTPVGQNLSTSADTEAAHIGQLGLEQAKEATQNKYREAQQANYEAERANQQSALAETMRHNKAEEGLKAAEYGIGPGGDEDKNFQTMVDKIGTYQAPPLNASATKNPRNFNIMAKVLEKYPDYDGTFWNNKNKSVQAFGGSGKQGQLVRSADVGIQHLGVLQEAADDLNNGQIPLKNRTVNFLKREFGISTAPTNFEATKKIVADEITKFITGSAANGGAVFDRKAMEDEVNSAMTPQALKGVMNKWVELMGGQIKGLKHEYEVNTRMGDFNEKLDPATRKRLGIDPEENVGRAPTMQGWKIEVVK